MGLLAAVAGAPCLAAQGTGLSLSGEYRARYELLDGQYRPGFPARDAMLALRGSLLAEWTGGNWKLAGQLMDSRAGLNGDGGVLSSNEVNTFEPVQAYVERRFTGPFGAGSSGSVALGRFTMNLGSRRLIASDDYRNTPNAYTGLRVDLALASKARGTLYYVLPQQRLPDDAGALRDGDFRLDREGREQQLFGLIAAQPGLLPGGVTGEVAYAGFRERDHGARATRDRTLHSFGLRAIRDAAAGQWDFEIEGIFQTGRISASTAPDAVRLDARSWFVHADAGYTFETAGRPRLSLEYDYASGDGPGSSFQRFDTLFGMRRADYAPSGIYGILGRTNMESLGVRLEAAPSERVDLLVTARALWAADRRDTFSTSGIRDASGASGAWAGFALDARIRYWIVPQTLRAEVNADLFLRGSLMRDAPNASLHGDTRYISAALSYLF